MIKNIIFDVNKVLRILNNEKLENYLPQDIFFKFKSRYRDVYSKEYIKKVYHNSIFTQYDLGFIERNDLIEKLSETYDEPIEVVQAFMDARCFEIHNTIFEPMINLIKKLRKNGYKTFILSNMGKDMADSLITMINKDNFDDVIFSCDVHMIKPNRDIFEYALKRFNINANESLFIDDYELNLIPFKSLGGHTYLFDYKKMEKAILEIENLIKNI